MNETLIFSALAGTYVTPYWSTSSSINVNYFSNQLNFEFYQDPACTILSTGQTGILTVKGRGSSNSLFQEIPSGNPFNVALAQSLNWNGVCNQLSFQIPLKLLNTNFIKIIFSRG